MKTIVALDNGGFREISVKDNGKGGFVIECPIWRRRTQTFDNIVDALLRFQEMLTEYENCYGNNYVLRYTD